MNSSLEFHGFRVWKFTVQEICLGLVVFFSSFFMLILFQLNPSTFIYFLNFISNSFITLKFDSKFNPTQYQLIPNQGSTRKKIREEKKRSDCPTNLAYCIHIHYSSRKFNVLIQINTM